MFADWRDAECARTPTRCGVSSAPLSLRGEQTRWDWDASRPTAREVGQDSGEVRRRENEVGRWGGGGGGCWDGEWGQGRENDRERTCEEIKEEEEEEKKAGETSLRLWRSWSCSLLSSSVPSHDIKGMFCYFWSRLQATNSFLIYSAFKSSFFSENFLELCRGAFHPSSAPFSPVSTAVFWTVSP